MKSSTLCLMAPRYCEKIVELASQSKASKKDSHAGGSPALPHRPAAMVTPELRLFKRGSVEDLQKQIFLPNCREQSFNIFYGGQHCSIILIIGLQ